jgi:Ser/Thr protein kinase RdoA (MazF antagonist)
MVNTEEIKKEISGNYNIHAARIDTLEGYGSLNYLITDASGKRYVFKQYTNETEFNLVREEIRILNSICDKLSFSIPYTIPTKDGHLSWTTANNHLSRLLHFIDGEFLYKVENSPEVLFCFGQRIAQVTKTLQQHESAEVKARRLSWDLQYFYLNFPLAKHIGNPSDKALVDYFFDQFHQLALHELPHLRHGLIHGDLHDLNVLVRNKKVTGFIDFGDISYTPLVADLAIALTYVMLNKKDPVENATHVIKGYHSEFALERKEIELLPHLITTRLCISLCHSAEAKIRSADTEYILISEKPAWKLIHHWITINPLSIQNSFLEAAGFAKNDLSHHREDILQKRNKFFGKSLSLSYREPVYFTGAAFQYMYDGDGNSYLDA